MSMPGVDAIFAVSATLARANTVREAKKNIELLVSFFAVLKALANKILPFHPFLNTDMEKYDMKYINSYIEELLAIQHVLYYIKDAAESLLLWRGTMPIQIGSQTFLFPIHSLSAFLVFTYLVERPQMCPTMFFFFIGWFMLAVMDYRRRSPDVWSRCKSFPEFVTILAVGSTPLPPANIKPFENQEESQKYLEAWQKRITDAEAEAAKVRAEKNCVAGIYVRMDKSLCFSGSIVLLTHFLCLPITSLLFRLMKRT
jgi:hypothetical protein